MAGAAAHSRLRDPAWTAGYSGACGARAACAALWATEFKPWIMFEPESLRHVGFVTGFFPPRLDREFLGLVAWEAWRTVAIATSGMALALLLAIPLTLASTAALSVSALPGRMNALPFRARQARAAGF